MCPSTGLMAADDDDGLGVKDEKLHQRSDPEFCGFVDCFLAVRAQNALTP